MSADDREPDEFEEIEADLLPDEEADQSDLAAGNGRSTNREFQPDPPLDLGRRSGER
ncbi:MAG: hypothetical protein ABSC51_01530 [Gaiellaceae bacterium]|jgi:hypothetical protein